MKVGIVDTEDCICRPYNRKHDRVIGSRLGKKVMGITASIFCYDPYILVLTQARPFITKVKELYNENIDLLIVPHANIPTNLISINDGQIYLSPQLFQGGLLPAVDVGKSVSRVGGKTQLASYQAVVGSLRLTYSQFQELEIFARFGTQLDENTRKILERGRRIREILKQNQYAPYFVMEQIVILLMVIKDYGMRF